MQTKIIYIYPAFLLPDSNICWTSLFPKNINQMLGFSPGTTFTKPYLILGLTLFLQTLQKMICHGLSKVITISNTEMYIYHEEVYLRHILFRHNHTITSA